MKRRLASVLLLTAFILAGCSRWPTVELFGDEYALSPFPPNETLSVPSTGSGGGSSEEDRAAPRNR